MFYLINAKSESPDLVVIFKFYSINEMAENFAGILILCQLCQIGVYLEQDEKKVKIKLAVLAILGFLLASALIILGIVYLGNYSQAQKEDHIRKHIT